MQYFQNMGLRLLKLFRQNRFKGLFEFFIIFKEDISHAPLNLICQFNQFLSCHVFWVFHIRDSINTIYKPFAQINKNNN